MDLTNKEKFDMEKPNGEDLNFHPANLAADWRFGTNIQTPFHAENSLTVSSSCASASMVDSFCPNLWDHPQSRNLACGENNLQTSSSNSYLVPARMLAPCSSSRPGLDRPLDYGWNPSMSLPKEAIFFQTGARILPQNLSQFPADSGFIDRAARLSCFSSGNFGDMVNPFHNLEPLNPFPANGGIHNTEVLSPKNVKVPSEAQNENNETPLVFSMPTDHGATDGSLLKDNRDTETLLKPSNEDSHRIETKSCESGEAEFSDDGQVDPANLENSREEPYNKEFGAKKRKRSSQEAEDYQVNGDQQLTAVAAKQNMDTKQKNEDTSPSTTPKLYGKSAKDGSKSSDAQKEDYIHVRARRGQATNSHSLAERVRREKISERMKFLQDLVPGCSKVTGKAVMLDEIINYVQSLQRQVEFLSMKLASVNPRLDFNLETLLSKDILQTRGATSSAIGFSPDMTMVHPQLQLSQQNLVPTGIPGIRNPSSALRRTTNPLITAINEFKEAVQMPNVWDDELHNVLEMSFGNNMPFAQESGGSLPPGHMKVEL